MRLRRRDTARCTSVSEREGVEESGDVGEEEVEETVHVESAEAGRRAVWKDVSIGTVREMKRTHVNTDVCRLGELARP